MNNLYSGLFFQVEVSFAWQVETQRQPTRIPKRAPAQTHTQLHLLWVAIATIHNRLTTKAL